MPNETDTTVNNNKMDETQELPAFPTRGADDHSSSQDHPVPAQYKALQEAQFLHEETLRQLRDEIQSQRQQISELADNQPDSNQPAMRTDAILLRLSELERKIGEDAPDPLLNEIVHRLASIENGGGGNADGRIEQLSEQLGELRRRVSTPNNDPRTDEMALRIASIEGSVRRTQETLQSETITENIAQLQASARETSEKVSTELADLRRQLEGALSQEQPDWTDRINSLESRLTEASSSTQAEELAARLTQLEQAQSESTISSGLNEVTAKVEEISGQLSNTADSASIAELQEKLAQLESQVAAPSDDPQHDGLSARVDQLQSALESQPVSTAVEALQERLSLIEQQREQAADPSEALNELRQRCDSFSDRLASLTEREVFETRIAAVEQQIGQAPTDTTELAEIKEKLAQLEESTAPPEIDGRLAELTARLRSLELQSEQGSQDDGRLERISSRLDQLELTGGSSGLANQVNELRERVAELASRPANYSNEDSSQLLASVTERLGLIESSSPTIAERIAQIEEKQATAGGIDQGDAVAELRQRVDQIVNLGGSSDTATTDILHEIGLRVQALERGEGGGSAGDDSEATAALHQRIESLEAQINATANSAQPDLQGIIDRLSYLEQSGLSAEGSEGSSSGPAPQIVEQLIARYEEIDGRLALMEETGPGEATASGSSEWVSSAMAEISELRQQITDVQESGTAGTGISDKFLGNLAQKISSGIATSEVKSMQTQLYAVYFVLALVGALTLSSLFMG